MSEKEFKYDVAFSFHSLDQSLAVELNDLLQDRFSTFIYMERQEDVLAGTDGEATFNSVFGEQARCVVVFCRNEWGETPFTRIEQTAIRNRAFEEGFDFSLFIPTDTPPTVPKWLPRTRLWYGINEFGLNGAAAVVERLVEELGGEPRIESVADRAARFQRAAKFQQERKEFRNNVAGVEAADAAFHQLKADLQQYSEQLSVSCSAHPKITIRDVHGIVLLTGAGACMAINWQRHFANSLDESVLKVDVFEGVPKLPGLSVWEDPRRLKSMKYDYQLVLPGKHGFVERGQSLNSHVLDDFAGELLKLYFDVAEKNRRR